MHLSDLNPIHCLFPHRVTQEGALHVVSAAPGEMTQRPLNAAGALAPTVGSLGDGRPVFCLTKVAKWFGHLPHNLKSYLDRHPLQKAVLKGVVIGIAVGLLGLIPGGPVVGGAALGLGVLMGAGFGGVGAIAAYGLGAAFSYCGKDLKEHPHLKSFLKFGAVGFIALLLAAGVPAIPDGMIDPEEAINALGNALAGFFGGGALGAAAHKFVYDPLWGSKPVVQEPVPQEGQEPPTQGQMTQEQMMQVQMTRERVLPA